MNEVYIIMSPNGGISLNLGDQHGTCYVSKERAEEALKSKNAWSASKGYGVYELVTLDVKWRK